MEDSELIARIDTNVKYLRESFDDHKREFKNHVEHDNDLAERLLYPLWDAHQQRKGAVHFGMLLSSGVGAMMTMLVMWFSGVIHK